MEISLLNQLLLGLIQGIFEWLPISSSAFVVLFANNVLGITDVSSLVSLALFFHLGTFFAALVYFRSEVGKLLGTLIHYRRANVGDRKLLRFMLVSFIVTSLFAIGLFQLLDMLSSDFVITGRVINIGVGFFLIVTGVMGFSSKERGQKKIRGLKSTDGIIAGLAQGFAVIPGISRSGTTTSALLLSNFDDTTALRLSFLMSLPVVLFGNIILNASEFVSGSFPLLGIVTAFVFGLLTISGLISLAKRITFHWFVLVFGVLMIMAGAV